MAPTEDARTTPSTAQIDAIASKRFPTSFRGWDSDAVRVHLVEVADLVREMQRHTSDLERRVAEAEAAARRADLTQLDPDEVDRVLGEETARVLRTARASAAEIIERATEQANLLASRAAEEAAAHSDEARAQALQVERDAAEAASAIRAAGEAHVADLRAAAEAELEERRLELEAALAETHQQARDESAAALARAEDDAAAIRRAATDEAARMRDDADRYAQQQRSDVDAEIAAQRSEADAELQAIAERARSQVEEAERMRERVLADLARRRKAARQHLEQLHAGRDRLLAAYEVIRSTTDAATDELSVVLADAKRAADDAARRVEAEPTPGTEEMLAELDLARLADLPLVVARASEIASEPEVGASVETAVETGAEPEAEPTPQVTADDEPPRTQVPEPPADPTQIAPAPPGRQDAGSAIDGSRRATKRLKRRGHDPLGGESLPAIPLEPIEGSADFEQVRVVEATAGDDSDTASQKTVDPEQPGTARGPHPRAGGPDRVEGVEPDASRSGDVESSDETGTMPAGKTKPGGSAAERALEQLAKDRDADPEPTEPGVSQPDVAAIDAEVSDLFARLRADQAASSADVDVEPDEAAPDEAVEPAATDTTIPAASSSTPDAPSKPTEPARSEKSASLSATTPPAVKTRARSASPGDAGVQRARERPAPAPTSTGPNARSTENALATLFERRDSAVEEVARRMAKHLKRQLSDHQSELLDELRRAAKVTSVEELIGASDEFHSEWTRVVSDDLQGAVAAGTLLAGDVCDRAASSVDIDLGEVIDELVEAVARPLYLRLERVLLDSDSTGPDGDDAPSTASLDERELADRIRACYREWRGVRLTSAVADAAARAFGSGLLAALPTDVGVSWYCGPGEQPCSDCNDNLLAGEVGSGEQFPTGQACAPAHPGCRCLVLPTRPG